MGALFKQQKELDQQKEGRIAELVEGGLDPKAARRRVHGMRMEMQQAINQLDQEIVAIREQQAEAIGKFVNQPAFVNRLMGENVARFGGPVGRAFKQQFAGFGDMGLGMLGGIKQALRPLPLRAENFMGEWQRLNQQQEKQQVGMIRPGAMRGPAPVEPPIMIRGGNDQVRRNDERQLKVAENAKDLLKLIHSVLEDLNRKPVMRVEVRDAL